MRSIVMYGLLGRGVVLALLEKLRLYRPAD
jgi:hypothetical protein